MSAAGDAPPGGDGVARRQLEILHAIAHRTRSAVLVTDAAGRIEWVNDAFARLTGYQDGEALGADAAALLDGPETAAAARDERAAAIAARRPYDVEVLCYGRGGRQFWVRLEGEPLTGAGGAFTGFVALATDVTEARIAAASAEVTKRIGDRLLACASVDQAAAIVTGELVSVLDVRAAQVWTVERDDRPLRYAAGSRAVPEAQAWLEETAAREFRRGPAWVVGVGAPGTAWGTGAACIRTDFWQVDQHGNLSRRALAAQAAGIRTVCATPVHGPEGVVAVIEIGGSHNYPGHERLPALLERVAHQLGAYLMQRRSLTLAEAANRELRRQIAARSAQLFAALRLRRDARRPPAALEAGAVINDAYRVEAKVGEGGMGAVYRVTRLEDDTTWAMKVATSVDDELLARLAREAHLLSHLRHPNVVQVVDIDVATAGFLFLVLEYVEGDNLHAWHRAQGALDPAAVIRILVHVARGLEALHAANIAHRDLKPQNVLVAGAGRALRVKLADFGISRRARATTEEDLAGAAGSGAPAAALVDALEGQTLEAAGTRELAAAPDAARDGETTVAGALRARGTGRGRDAEAARPVAAAPGAEEGAPGTEVADTQPTGLVDRASQPARLDVTRQGQVAGTPHFIAPELLAREGACELRADLFSFGVLAYALASGRLPFDEPPSTLLRARRGPPPAPAPLPPTWAPLAPLLARCLSFAPGARPSAVEALATLEELAGWLG